MCLCVYVPYPRPQFWVDLHEIWHVASLYPTDGMGVSKDRSSLRVRALRAMCILLQMTGELHLEIWN